MLNQILLGDCYELMKGIPDGSIDAVISDFPYNTTQAKWDYSLINLPLLWDLFDRILKPAGAVVTTTAQPFTSQLIMSNLWQFKHETIWHKSQATGHLNALIQPMREHENIVVFSSGKVTYNPQLNKKLKENIRPVGRRAASECYGKFNEKADRAIPLDMSYPRSVVEFNNTNHGERGLHPTQKPIELYEYLIRTYTNPGDLILDPFAGSATTAIAAMITGRNFICLEKDPKYHEIANKRLALAQMQGRFEEMVG